MLFFREREEINLSSYRWGVGLQFASGIECPFCVKWRCSEKVCVVGVATFARTVPEHKVNTIQINREQLEPVTTRVGEMEDEHGQ